MIKILQSQFRRISECELEDLAPHLRQSYLEHLIAKRFRLYIEYHKVIMQYLIELNQLELSLTVVMLSSLLFLIILLDDLSRIIIACIYIFAITYQLFIEFWTADELKFQVIPLSTNRKRYPF